MERSGNLQADFLHDPLRRRHMRPFKFAAEPFFHHLRAALAVGSVVTLLHGFGLLGWLDGLMLRLVSGSGPVWRAQLSAPEPLPSVLLIGARLYESEFGQASPLAPAKLAQIVRTIGIEGGSRPAVLAIDLDLSPGPAEAANDVGRLALDAALRQLVDAGSTVVLPLPLRVSTPELQQKKFQWLQSLCAWNAGSAKGRVIFGLADITLHQGVAMQLDTSRPSIGVLAATPDESQSFCRRAQAPEGDWRAALLASAFDNRALVPQGNSAWRPYNVRLFAPGAHVGVMEALDRLPVGTGSLAGRTVFLGSGYNPQDRFVVPLEGTGRPVEGVLIHAAAYDSMLHPIGTVEGLSSFILDIVTGVLLGYCFSASWGWHQRRVALAGGSGELLVRLAPRLSLLLNFAFAGALATLFVLAARMFLFPLNLWINPGPMVIGVFAKFVLASRHEEDDGHTPVQQAGAALRLRCLDRAGLAVLVAAAIASILLGH